MARAKPNVCQFRLNVVTLQCCSFAQVVLLLLAMLWLGEEPTTMDSFAQTEPTSMDILFAQLEPAEQQAIEELTRRVVMERMCDQRPLYSILKNVIIMTPQDVSRCIDAFEDALTNRPEALRHYYSADPVPPLDASAHQDAFENVAAEIQYPAAHEPRENAWYAPVATSKSRARPRPHHVHQIYCQDDLTDECFFTYRTGDYAWVQGYNNAWSPGDDAWWEGWWEGNRKGGHKGGRNDLGRYNKKGAGD